MLAVEPVVVLLPLEELLDVRHLWETYQLPVVVAEVLVEQE